MDHSTVILHFDIDHFYSQVEEVMNPALKNFPVGIKQGNHIVTCNYEARKYGMDVVAVIRVLKLLNVVYFLAGVEKWKPIEECLEKCPNLKIVPGEDLKNYKIFSNKITNLLTESFGSEIVEKLGLDEHYLDITHLVETKLKDSSDSDMYFFEGACSPDEDSFKSCACGCERRLKVGSMIANDIRRKIIDKIGLTCSVGIAHNKLLGK